MIIIFTKCFQTYLVFSSEATNDFQIQFIGGKMPVINGTPHNEVTMNTQHVEEMIR